MRRAVLTREDDDPLAKTRISLGETKDDTGFYLVFRGKPEDVIRLLEEALKVAKAALLSGHYTDKRQKPPGKSREKR